MIDIHENTDSDEFIFELLDDFTSGGKLYYDDKRESIWMINPETKEWIFEFAKSGDMYYSYLIFKNIFKYISMEHPDFNPYITKWVERILQKEIKDISIRFWKPLLAVERILQNEVKDISGLQTRNTDPVERILQSGTELNPDENINESIKDSEEHLEVIFELLDDFTSGGKLYYDDVYDSIWMINPKTKEWIFEFENSGDLYYSYPTFVDIFKYISMEYPDFESYIKKWVERILQNEVKDTIQADDELIRTVERILQKGTELNPDENINESIVNSEDDKLEVIFELLDDFTSGGKLYYDDDEDEDSIWMINPETKEWIFEFEKSGFLYYSYPIFVNIFKWISMEHPDFNPYIAKWVERILQNEVKDTFEFQNPRFHWVKRILQKGNELNPDENINESVVDSEEDKLEMIFELLDDFTSAGKLYYDNKRDSIWMINPETKEWIFEFKKSGNLYYSYRIFANIFKWISMEYPDFNPYIAKWVERILQKEVKNTYRWEAWIDDQVERILQKEVKDTWQNSLGRQIPVERILQNEVKDTFEFQNPRFHWVKRILQKGNELNPDENINESVVDSEEDKLEMIFELLDDFTSAGKLYYDDKTESIWMINPETKQWIFEFEKSGKLWYSYPIFVNIFKYISMEFPRFNPYIKKWVERILQKEVKNTSWCGPCRRENVERILQKEVKNTGKLAQGFEVQVERILQKGNELNPDENINEGVDTNNEEDLEVIFELLDDFTSGGKLYYHEESIWMINPETKEWIFEFEKSGDLWYSYWVFTNIFKYISMEHPDFEPYITKWVERILQNEVKNTRRGLVHRLDKVERILQKGNELKIKEKNDKMKDIKENFDWRAILSNIVGDKFRATLGKIPGLNVPVGAASIILNYDELNDDMEQYYQLKKEFESRVKSGKPQEGSDNLLERFKQVEEELKVDFIDMMQSAGEMAIPGFRVFNIIGMPLLTSLAIEDILDEVSKVLPFDEKAEDSMIPYLAAIKDIGNMKKQLEPYEKPEDVLDELIPPITEGRKKTGTKLCARGKAAAKAKFEVYPSAYSNGYGVQVCKGKIKGLDGKRRCSPPYC